MSNPERSEANDSPSTNFQNLVEKTIEKFWSQRAFRGPGGQIEHYGTLHAASDAMAEMCGDRDGDRDKLDPELFGRLLKQTPLRPKDVDLSLVQELVQEGEMESWDEWCAEVLQEVVVTEIERAHPEIIKEQGYRLKLEEELSGDR